MPEDGGGEGIRKSSFFLPSFLPFFIFPLSFDPVSTTNNLQWLYANSFYLVDGRLGNNNSQESSLGGLADPFQRLEWNAFMDDFDWSFTSNYLGVGGI